MRVGDRLDGHWVQGHVDQVGELVEIHDEQGSWRLYDDRRLSRYMSPLSRL